MTPAARIDSDHIRVDGREFYFFREHFPFGQFEAYRTPSTEGEHFRFIVRRDTGSQEYVATPAELADHLEANYYQVAEAGIRAAMSSYADLRALPA